MLFRGASIQEILIMLVLFVFSITIHEISHGYVAYKLGDPTAKNAGRLTMNPLSHLDLMGTLLILIAGFGWAKPVPVNSRYFKNPGRDMAIVSIAGPISNLLLSFIALLIYVKVVFPLKNTMPENFYSAAELLLVSMASLNIALAVFNLIPIPPLDGSRILLAIAPYKWRNFIYSIERYGMIVLFILLYVISPFIMMVTNAIFTWFITIIDFLPF